MIYSDRDIEKAIRQRRFIVDPVPSAEQYDSSSLNLRVGDDFHIWKPALRTRGSKHGIDIDHIALEDLIGLSELLAPNADGLVVIPPDAFVLVRTLEHVSLPLKSKLAARVEGRSKMARLGMTAHITAPTIHAGFAGKITLEILNHGPFRLEVRPNQSRLCQLIIEEVSSVPRRAGSGSFSQQSTPLGSPKSK